MKKRNIIIISLSIAGLVFGGLVFLGVSTFPELLEKEKEEIEHPSNDVLLNAPSNQNKKSDEAAIVISPNSQSNYVIETNKNSDSPTHLSSFYNYEVIHYNDDRVVVSIKENTTSKEIANETTNEIKTPSTYYKGKSYVSLKREIENKDLLINERLNQNETTNNRNKNIVNTIILVVVAIEALALIFLNKKRHPRQLRMPRR